LRLEWKTGILPVMENGLPVCFPAAVDLHDAAPLSDLRRIAADATLVSTLRKAAIHAIGWLGGEEDLVLLESLPADDGNLSAAVLPARQAKEP
jgi:hypothetical protein